MPLSLQRQRDIEQISARIVVQKRAERIFVNNEILPRNTEIVEGKRYYTYPILNMQGRAAIIANKSFDVPDVDAFVSERTTKLELMYQPWTIPFPDEIESNSVGTSLRPIKIELAAQAMYNAIDDIGYGGIPDLGIYGMVNQPNVLTYTLPADGAGGSTAFKDKDAEQILRDITGIAYYASKVTLHAYNTTKLMLPVSAWEALSQKVMTTYGVAETALTRFLVNQAYSVTGGMTKNDIIIGPALDTAGSGGTSVAIAYNPRPDYVSYLRTGIRQRPLFETVEGVKSAMYGYNGGTLVQQNLSMVKIPGI